MYGGVIHDVLVFPFGVSWFSNAPIDTSNTKPSCSFME